LFPETNITLLAGCVELPFNTSIPIQFLIYKGSPHHLNSDVHCFTHIGERFLKKYI
jgi:hypothetical protein